MVEAREAPDTSPVESRDYYAELVECRAAEFRFTVTRGTSAFGHIPGKSTELSTTKQLSGFDLTCIWAAVTHIIRNS